MIALLASLALIAPADAQAATTRHGGCHTHSCRVRVARKACARGSVRACVRRGALQHHQDPGRMLAVAMCESTMRPWATNGIYVGLFQFGPALWSELRYRAHSRLSAKWSSLAAALAFRLGLAYKWDCA